MPFRDALPEFDPIVLPGGFTHDGEPEEIDASAYDIVSAAARQANVIGSALSYTGPTGDESDFDPEYSVWDDISGTEYQAHSNRFVGLRTRSQVGKMKSQIDMESRDRRLIGQAGFGGFAAEAIASIIDLPTLIPGGALIRTARGGFSTVRSATSVGAAAATGAAAAELGLQASQELRTGTESALAIGGSVILGAALGGALSGVSNASHRAMVSQLAVATGNVQNMTRQVQSVGAAQATPTNLRLVREEMFQTLKKIPVLGLLTRADPLIRGVTSDFQSVRSLHARLFDTPLQWEANLSGEAMSPGGSWEQRIKFRTNSELANAHGELNRIFSEYWFNGPVGMVGRISAGMSSEASHLLGAKGKLPRHQFYEEVGKALARGDQHAIPEVAQAAQMLRSRILNPAADELVTLGIFDQMPQLHHGHTYVTRIFNQEKIKAQFDRFARVLADEFVKAQRAAAAADPSVQVMTFDEALVAAQDTANTIIGLEPGTHHINAAVASPLKARVLDVPDSVIEEWLERDAGVILDAYFRRLVPDIEFVKQFGLRNPKAKTAAERPSVNSTVEAMLEDIKDESDALAAAAKSEKRSRAIKEDARFRMDDLRDMIDRVRGRYQVPANPRALGTRALRASKTLSYTGYLGGMTISAIPDVAHVIGRNSVGAFGEMLAETMTSPTRIMKARDDILDFGASAEWYLNSRNVAIAEIMDPYGMNSAFERGISGAGTAFSKLTGMSQWNVAGKSIGGMMMMSKLLRAADAVKRGKATRRQLTALAENNIDRTLAVRIADQFSQHGDQQGRLWIAQGRNWTDAQARDALGAALNSEMDKMVITPGQDKPLFMSHEVFSLFAQFKSFAFAANHRILLSGLQRADGNVLAAWTIALLLGGMVSDVKQWQFGRKRKEGADFWIDALDRSGLAGVIFEANAFAELANVGLSRVTGDLPSRFAARDDLLGIAGPSVSNLNNLVQLSAAIQRGDVRQSDVGKALNLVPGNNLPYFIWLNNEVERGVTSALGGKLRDQ